MTKYPSMKNQQFKWISPLDQKIITALLRRESEKNLNDPKQEPSLIAASAHFDNLANRLSSTGTYRGKQKT